MLRRILKRLVGSAPAEPPPPPPPPGRNAYKAVWNGLGDTESRAKLHVMGSEKEEDFVTEGVRTHDVLARTVGIGPEDIVLEIGCGVGRVGRALAPVCRQWIGCDVSSNMLEHTRRRLQEFPNVTLVEISGCDLKPIPDQSVDVVYCTIVFMHLEEWDRYNYVLEAHRVLRPGGRVFVDNFSICSDEGWKVFEIHRTTFTPEQREAHISKSSTPQELETYLRRAGFQNVQGATEGPLIHYWGVKP